MAELEQSSLRVHRGSGALHATSRAARSAAVVVASFPALSSGLLGLRVYVYVPADQPTRTMNLIYLGTDPSLDVFDGVDLNLEDGAVQLFSPQFDPERFTGTVAVPRDRWFCLRVLLEVADRAGAVQVHVDDQLALEATGQDTRPVDGITTLRAGIDWSSAQDEPFEVYMDDLLLAREDVPCL